MTGVYELIEYREPASVFHARPIPADPTPQIWANRVTAPALVLGSTQRREEIVDEDACRAAGVEVVRRRSGGGAVLLTPGEVGWIDVIVPAGATGWAPDIHRPMHWLGDHLAAILREARGADEDGDVTVNQQAMIETPWSRLVCFDGVGPGEVLVDGCKLIGISQRRTREAARLQCSWYTRYDAARLVALLADDIGPQVDQLRPVALLDPQISATLPARLAQRVSSEGASGE